MTSAAPAQADPPAPSLALLALASSLSPFGMVVVIPTLAAMAREFGVGFGQTQFLIAAYLFGLGVGQPVTGALADRHGRRPVILAGFALFTLASIACSLSKTFDMLVVLRFLQALGVSVGTVGSRAIVRDTHDALGAVRALAWIGAAMGVAPVLGPVIGGTLSAWAGPTVVFDATALLGLVVTVALGMALPETRQAAADPAERQAWYVSYGQLLGSRVFMGYTLMYAFTQGAFFAFLAVGAVVFQQHLGLGQQQFGAIWGAMGLVYIAGAAIGARLSGRVRPATLLSWAVLGSLLGGWSLAGANAAAGVTLAGLIVPLMILMATAGIQTPLATAGAVNCRPDVAGTAAGLSSAVGLVASGVFSMVAGALYADSFAPVAWLIAGAASMTAVTWRMVRA